MLTKRHRRAADDKRMRAPARTVYYFLGFPVWRRCRRRRPQPQSNDAYEAMVANHRATLEAADAKRKARTEWVQTATLRRIGHCGDMHIRISTRAFEVILRAAGFPGALPTDDTHREIDAAALEALVRLGQRP